MGKHTDANDDQCMLQKTGSGDGARGSMEIEKVEIDADSTPL